MCREAGRFVGALAGKAQHAERHVNAGVDVIVAQGYEAGGHTGEIGTMVLIPEIVDAVAPVPVLGAGGIGRGRQMAAAMALGAQGVWCGSVWLTTDEAETHPVVKREVPRRDVGRHDPLAVANRQARAPVEVGVDRRVGRTPRRRSRSACRCSRSSSTKRSRRIDRAAFRAGSGAEKLANYFVGQIVGTMNESKPAAQVVYDMIEEFIEAVESLSRQLET